MLSSSETGTWIPAFVPASSPVIAVLLVLCSVVTSATVGYDGSMVNGLNILPSYVNYFNLDDATTGLQTSSVFIGGAIAGLTWGKATDYLGRRPALFWAALLTLVAVVLQSAAQNIAMFTVARILIGLGTGMSGLAAPAYLAETLPLHWRGWGLGILNDCYYIGGLIAAGVTYGTFNLESTWSWRIPSAIQGATSVLCILILPFIPESPRWLVYQDRKEAALEVVAQTYASGDRHDPIVLAAFKEIVDTIEHEKEAGETLSVLQMFRTPTARKRVLLACSAAVFSVIAGNVISSYYLGTMLTNAGITDPTTQLQINVILNAWCLVVSVCGTWSVDQWGRKPTGVSCASALTVFLFLIGALTAVYGTSSDSAGVYGTVAAIFLFQGAYSFGWTPLLTVYPPEVLNYPIRANGLGAVQFSNNAVALLIVFTMPIALTNIGWKTYMINGAWDVIVVLIMARYWVETKGKSLEEIDEAFEGKKHSDVPDLEKVYQDRAAIDVVEVAAEVATEVNMVTETKATADFAPKLL